MRYKLLFSAIIILLCLNISAQRFNGGLLAGLNATQIDGDNWSGYHKMGFLFGAFVTTDFNDKWGGQLEIKYSGKGSATPAIYPDPKVVSFRYIDLPVLATYKAVNKLNIQAGMSFNYLFSAMLYDGDWYDFEDPCRKFESSLTFGLNYNLFQNIDINARFSYSLYPVRSKLSTSSWGEGAWFNNVVSFSVYYNIGNNLSE